MIFSLRFVKWIELRRGCKIHHYNDIARSFANPKNIFFYYNKIFLQFKINGISPTLSKVNLKYFFFKLWWIKCMKKIYTFIGGIVIAISWRLIKSFSEFLVIPSLASIYVVDVCRKTKKLNLVNTIYSFHKK